MLSRVWVAVVLVCGAALPARAGAPADVPLCPSAEEKPDVALLVKRTDKLLSGRSSVGTMTMAIKTPSWSRSLKMKVWSQGKDFALIRILEGGPRETGMMTLKREKQLWNWLPQAGRVMKLPSGMMGDSWMGSDFTNDDLVKGNSLTDDFDSSVTGIEKADGKEVWHVVLKPKPTAVVVWGRIEMLIERGSCMPVAQLFFDEDGKLARKMTYSDFKQIGWRLFPSKFIVHPSDPGHETSITYGDIEFDQEIPEETFSLQRLRQGR